MLNENDILNGYKVLGIVGRGSYGCAYKAYDEENDRLVVLKEVPLTALKETDMNNLKQEVALLKKLNNPYIIKYYDSFNVHGIVYIVMEYASDGDLHNKIMQQKEPFDSDTLYKWLIEICLGLQYLHTNKIIHRDIKPQNIFMMKDGTCRIGDFGISRILQYTCEKAFTPIGTPLYTSPEICSGSPYNFATDLWSLGCVLYELLNFQPPFQARSLGDLMNKIKYCNYKPLPLTVNKELRDITLNLLLINPTRRLKPMDILKRDIIKKNLETYFPQYKDIFKESEEKQKPIFTTEELDRINKYNTLFGFLHTTPAMTSNKRVYINQDAINKIRSFQHRRHELNEHKTKQQKDGEQKSDQESFSLQDSYSRYPTISESSNEQLHNEDNPHTQVENEVNSSNILLQHDKYLSNSNMDTQMSVSSFDMSMNADELIETNITNDNTQNINIQHILSNQTSGEDQLTNSNLEISKNSSKSSSSENNSLKNDHKIVSEGSMNSMKDVSENVSNNESNNISDNSSINKLNIIPNNNEINLSRLSEDNGSDNTINNISIHSSSQSSSQSSSNISYNISNEIQIQSNINQSSQYNYMTNINMKTNYNHFDENRKTYYKSQLLNGQYNEKYIQNSHFIENPYTKPNCVLEQCTVHIDQNIKNGLEDIQKNCLINCVLNEDPVVHDSSNSISNQSDIIMKRNSNSVELASPLLISNLNNDNIDDYSFAFIDSKPNDTQNKIYSIENDPRLICPHSDEEFITTLKEYIKQYNEKQVDNTKNSNSCEFIDRDEYGRSSIAYISISNDNQIICITDDEDSQNIDTMETTNENQMIYSTNEDNSENIQTMKTTNNMNSNSSNESTIPILYNKTALSKSSLLSLFDTTKSQQIQSDLSVDIISRNTTKKSDNEEQYIHSLKSINVLNNSSTSIPSSSSSTTTSENKYSTNNQRIEQSESNEITIENISSNNDTPNINTWKPISKYDIHAHNFPELQKNVHKIPLVHKDTK